MSKRHHNQERHSEVRPKEDLTEAGAGAAPPPSETIVSAADYQALEARLAEKEKELAELRDKYLRVLADSENARKRMRQQGEETVRQERERLLRELLPAIDNLERAVEHARGGGNGKPIVEGVEMVLRALLDFLRGHGVTQQNAVGQPFDPQLHEAVEHVESACHPANTVVEEFSRGYLIGDRVLRPARVSVAKAVERGEEGGGGEVDGSGGQNGGEEGRGNVEKP